MMQDRFAARKKLIETQETYYKKFKKVLNIRQVEALFKDNGPKRAQRPCIKILSARNSLRENGTSSSILRQMSGFTEINFL